MRFRDIRKSEHYKKYHESSFVWDEVLEIIFSIKWMRKKGGSIEYKDKRCYISGRIEKNILWIINAKRR
jgi:hypothetical protein